MDLFLIKYGKRQGLKYYYDALKTVIKNTILIFEVDESFIKKYKEFQKDYFQGRLELYKEEEFKILFNLYKSGEIEIKLEGEKND